jgi:hypothetical protein
MNERLLKIMEHFNYSPSIFADEIGVIRSSISHIISGRNNPGLELLQKVLIRFPQISSDWLILGRGEMMLNEDELEKRRMTNVNQPKKIGQLNLDDFTSPRENQSPELKQGVKPAELQPQENIFSRHVPEQKSSAVAEPVKQQEHEKTDNIKEERSPLPATTKPKSSVKRVTLYFDDNTFKDFVESV